MGHKDDGSSCFRLLRQVLDTFRLEFLITDRKHLVNHLDICINVRCNGVGETNIHAIGVVLDRRIKKSLDSRKIDNRVKATAKLKLGATEECSVEEYVLTSGKLGMKSGTHFQ